MWSTSLKRLTWSTVLVTDICTIFFRTLKETSFLSLETCPEIHLIIRDIMLKRNLADPERVQVSNWEVPGIVDRARLSGMSVFFRKYVCILAGSLTLRKVLRGQSNEMSVLLALTL